MYNGQNLNSCVASYPTEKTTLLKYWVQYNLSLVWSLLGQIGTVQPVSSVVR